MAHMWKEEFKTFEGAIDRFTLIALSDLISKGFFDQGSLSPISVGKEAKVFRGTDTAGKHVAVKIYRLETCDFNRIYSYIQADPRFGELKKRKREIIFAWSQREFRNLMLARDANVRAPLPIAFQKNILVMEFIGNGPEPAPKLKDLYPEDPVSFFKQTMKAMRSYFRAGMVHGDLSAFNILNLDEKPVFIDFSQSTTMKNPNAQEYLVRDVKNVCTFFRKIGVKADDKEELQAIIKK